MERTKYHGPKITLVKIDSRQGCAHSSSKHFTSVGHQRIDVLLEEEEEVVDVPGFEKTRVATLDMMFSVTYHLELHIPISFYYY